MPKKIISNVKEVMEREGFTIRKMENMTGLTHITILKARSDNIINCKLSTLHTLASAMNVSIKELFDYIDAKKHKS